MTLGTVSRAVIPQQGYKVGISYGPHVKDEESKACVILKVTQLAIRGAGKGSQGKLPLQVASISVLRLEEEEPSTSL